MAEVAVPLDQGIVRLDDLERVGTTTLSGHGEDVDTGWMAACLLPKVVVGRTKAIREVQENAQEPQTPKGTEVS